MSTAPIVSSIKSKRLSTGLSVCASSARYSIQEAKPFFKDYFGGQEIFHEHGWERMYEKHGGYLPLSFRSIPEGLVVPTGNVLETVHNTDDEFPWLTNFAESLNLHMWYPITVSTYSMEAKRAIAAGLLGTGAGLEGLLFTDNDFGFRAATSVQAARRAGFAHLVHSTGTDNVPGVRYAQQMYGAKVVGASLAASEHYIMTLKGKQGEPEQLDLMLDRFSTGLLACVADSYNIYDFINIYLRERKDRILARDGVFVVRPDSGDPPRMAVEVLNMLGDVFGYTTRGEFKILPKQVRMIYGDGINYESIQQILLAVYQAGWSIENIVFGMGGARMQQVNRDTQQFATKVWEAIINGETFKVWKDPVTSHNKASKGGQHKLVREYGTHGRYATVPMDQPGQDILRETARDGRLIVEVSFEEVQANVPPTAA